MESATEAAATRPAVTRRTVLVAGGVVGAAGALAACGGSSATPTTSPTTAAPSTTTAAPTTSGAAPTSAAGQPIAQAADIPVGGGSVFKDQGIVVTQPTAGEFAAFTAECPHQGCLVSEVKDNQIVCPCHMSLFSAQTGAVEQGPAVKGLVPIPISDVDGTLYVS